MVDGMEATRRVIRATVAKISRVVETFNVGSSTGTPVDCRDYKCPFPFTGKLNKVTVKLGPSRLLPPDKKKAEKKVGERD
jgi:arylsulfatase